MFCILIHVTLLEVVNKYTQYQPLCGTETTQHTTTYPEYVVKTYLSVKLVHTFVNSNNNINLILCICTYIYV